MQLDLFDRGEPTVTPARCEADDWPELRRATLQVLVTQLGEPIDDHVIGSAVIVLVAASKCNGVEARDTFDWLGQGGYVTEDSSGRMTITDKGLDALGLNER